MIFLKIYAVHALAGACESSVETRQHGRLVSNSERAVVGQFSACSNDVGSPSPSR